MAPVWRHQCLPSPALATAVAVRFHSSIVFDDLWNLAVCGEYLKSSARTLLLDPATSIAELACTLLLYLAVSFCCACHYACCICSAWVSCHHLLFIILPPASVTKTQKSVTVLKKSPKSDTCILIIIKVSILQLYGGFVG